MANGLWVGNIQDGYGRCVSTGVTIEVRDPANDLVALYRDKAGTQPLGNPFITLEDGIIKFYCEAGRVDIYARKGADEHILRNEIVLDDWVEAAPGCQGVLVQSVKDSLTLPAECTAGNLIIAFCMYIGDTPILAGFTEEVSFYPGTYGVALFSKLSDGTELTLVDNNEAFISSSCILEIADTVEIVGTTGDASNGTVPFLEWDLETAIPATGAGIMFLASDEAVSGSPNYFDWAAGVEFSGAETSFAFTDNAISDSVMDGGGSSEGYVAVQLMVLQCPAEAPAYPSDSRLLLLNEGTIALPMWDAPGFTNYQELSFAPLTLFYTASASRDGTLIALGGQGSPYWALADNTLTDITPAVTLANRCFSIAVSPDGAYIAAAHHETSPYITVMDVADGYSTSQPASAPGVRPDTNGRVAWNHNASMLAICGSQSPRLMIYNMPGFSLVSPGPTAYSAYPHTAVVFNADGSILYALADNKVICYDTADFSVATIVTGLSDGSCIAYSEALGLLAVGTFNGHVHLVSLTTFTVIETDATYAVGGNGTTSVAFSYDDTLLVATHNFSPFAVVYTVPDLTETAFDPEADSNLDYLDGGLFIPFAAPG